MCRPDVLVRYQELEELRNLQNRIGFLKNLLKGTRDQQHQLEVVSLPSSHLEILIQIMHTLIHVMIHSVPIATYALQGVLYIRELAVCMCVLSFVCAYLERIDGPFIQDEPSVSASDYDREEEGDVVDQDLGEFEGEQQADEVCFVHPQPFSCYLFASTRFDALCRRKLSPWKATGRVACNET